MKRVQKQETRKIFANLQNLIEVNFSYPICLYCFLSITSLNFHDFQDLIYYVILLDLGLG